MTRSRRDDPDGTPQVFAAESGFDGGDVRNQGGRRAFGPERMHFRRLRVPSPAPSRSKTVNRAGMDERETEGWSG
jgi:hypothetical protein